MIPVPQGVYKRIDINNKYIYLKKQSTCEKIKRKVNNVVKSVLVMKMNF